MTDSLSAGDLFLIHLFLFASNCFSSVVQGLTGFGDAIMLHVLFQVVCASPTSIFRQTPLGAEPFRIVVILMYVRVIFSAPLLAYWSLKDGLFSKTMTLMMAVPSTVTALIGVVWASNSGDDMLKMILGISSLVFAILYVLIIVVRFVMKRMRRKKLVEVLDQGGQDPSQESTVVRIERGKDVVIVNESQLVQRMHNDSFASMPGAPQRDENGDGHAPLGSLQVNRNSDSRLGEEYSSEGVEVLESVRGSPFSADEARIPHPTEDNAPPLSPGKLSPLATLTYTRVRINRNLDENGKIKMTTKIGASFFSALSGVMGSLTGVGGPAQIIFILLFDVPNYIIKVNFCMQSIPSAAVRFFAALFNGTLKSGMIPYFINSLIAGYVGIYIGSRMGKLVGPMSYNIFVLGLLLISSLIMITNNVWLLMGSLLVTLAITIGVAYWELKKMKPAVDSQRALEKELDDIEGHPTTTNTNNDNDKDTNYNKNNKVVKGGNESDEEDGTTPVSNNSMNSVRRVRRAELKRPPSLFLDDTTANNRKYVGEENVKHRSEEDEDLPV